MNIAFIVHDLSRKKGHDRYGVELINFLIQKGCKVTVFTNSIQCNISGFLYKKVMAVKKPILIKILTFLFFSSLIIKRKKYDIIHAQGLCTLWANIITAHICHAGYFKVVKKYYTEGGVIRRLYYSIMCYLLSILEKLFFNLPWVKIIVSPSQKVKNELIKYYGIDENKIKVIYHGVNLDEFNYNNRKKYRDIIRQKYSIRKDEPVILFVGEFWRKGLKIVLEAISKFKDVKLFVVGPGDIKHYQTMAEKLGISRQVIFTGETVNANQYYSASDIFVCLSRYESFGLVVTEAMASGIPVIISKEMGVSELITHDYNGIILKNIDSYCELAEYILKLLSERDYYEKIRTNGMEMVRELNWTKTAELTYSEYINIIGKT